MNGISTFWDNLSAKPKNLYGEKNSSRGEEEGGVCREDRDISVVSESFDQKAASIQHLLLSLVMETLEGTELCFPQLFNTSCRKPMRTHFEAMLTYILLSSISVLTVTLNLLVIISISHFK